MNRTVVLTGVGQDRVGIVAELTQLLYELGCNLLDSSMTLLRGEFALILMAELPKSVSVSQLEESLRHIERQLGMTIHVRTLNPEELTEEPADANAFMVSVYGADQPGIVAKATRALADNKINITDVQTKRTGQIFVMFLEVTAPAGMAAHGLESALNKLRKELAVDITVQSLETVEL